MGKPLTGLKALAAAGLTVERNGPLIAPAAYKDIGPVVQVQAEAGIASPVARMRPLLTFKG